MWRKGAEGGFGGVLKGLGGSRGVWAVFLGGLGRVCEFVSRSLGVRARSRAFFGGFDGFKSCE